MKELIFVGQSLNFRTHLRQDAVRVVFNAAKQAFGGTEPTEIGIGFVPDDERYFDVHHSDNDVFESVNAREMQLGTAAITILAYLISEEGL